MKSRIEKVKKKNVLNIHKDLIGTVMHEAAERDLKVFARASDFTRNSKVRRVLVTLKSQDDKEASMIDYTNINNILNSQPNK